MPVQRTIYILVDGGKIPRFLSERITRVQEYYFGFRERLDDRLHQGRISFRQSDVVVAKPRMELHCE